MEVKLHQSTPSFLITLNITSLFVFLPGLISESVWCVSLCHLHHKMEKGNKVIYKPKMLCIRDHPKAKNPKNFLVDITSWVG